MTLMLQTYNIFCFHPNFFVFICIFVATGTFTRQIPKISLISVACPYLNLNNRKSSMDKSLRFVHAAFFISYAK